MLSLLRNLPRRSLYVFFLIAVTACDGDISGGSSGNFAPIVDAGPDQNVRTQSEVILSGRDSDDLDGVILDFDWNIVSGPSSLSKDAFVFETRETIKFTVPEIFEATTWIFELTATDDKGATATDQVRLTAHPPTDPDKFLTYFDIVPTTFKVVAGTEEIAAEILFDITVETNITYPTVRGTTTTRRLSINSRSGRWLPSTSSGCADPDEDPDVINQVNSPRFTFRIPKLNVDDLNRMISDPGERLDESDVDSADIQLTVNLNTPTLAIGACLFVLDEFGKTLLHTSVRKGNATQSNAASEFEPQITFSADDLLQGSFQENKERANAYYATIDPGNSKTTLSAWRMENGFDNGSDAEAIYINGFDLGFTRDMFLRTDPDGNVY